MSERASAVAIIEKFNGQTVLGSSAPLQVRFADSPAQKKLKNQTARKRILRPRDFQPMAGFPVRPMMPITPETMLGIAPAGAGQPYYHDQQYIHYSAPLMTATVAEHPSPGAPSTEGDSLASPPDDDMKELAAQVEQKLQVSANGNDSISVSH